MELKTLNVCFESPAESYEGEILKLKELGAPDWSLAEDNLTKLLQSPEGFKYLYCLRPTPENHSDEITSLCRRAVKRALSSEGNYNDSLKGVENVFTNLHDILKQPDLSDLQANNFTHAALISAGPSLDDEIENIKKAKNHGWLIVCVDTVYKKLLNEDIKPHLVVTAERDDLTKYFFTDTDQTTMLVAPMLVNPEIPKNYQGPLVYVKRGHAFFNWFPFTDRKKVFSGSSVAPFALAVVAELGIKNVALVGQDLSYKKNSDNTYSTHSEIKIENLEFYQKKYTFEELIRDYEVAHVKGNIFPQVLTNPMWMAFAQQLEFVANHYELNCKATSAKGVYLRFAPYQALWKWVEETSPVTNPSLSIDFDRSLMRKDTESHNIHTITSQANDLFSNEPLNDLFDIHQFIRTPHFGTLAFDMVFPSISKYESLKWSGQNTHMAEKQLKLHIHKAWRDLRKIMRKAANYVYD